MTIHEFALPDLGEGLEDAEITGWRVDVGDEVALNQPLCAVETAKAEVEIPSPYEGTVVERRGEVGDVVPVGSVLVRIEEATGEPARQPVLVGYGVAESDAPRRRRSRSRAAAPPAATGDRPLAKPPVRKLAKTLDVDLAAIAPGSGSGGVITRDDVLAAAGQAAPSDGEAVPLRGVRRAIAEHVARSRAEIPDATCSRWVDATELLAVREAARGEQENITPFAVLLRLLVAALPSEPALNARLDAAAGEIRHSEAIHLGIAVDAPRGLLVPVLRDAHDRSLREIADELERLAHGARDGTLAPADMVGSTFSVSNFGAFGLDEGVPVINHPEAAILGVGAIKPRPWVHEGELAVRSTMHLTCVFDHRIADGAEAGRLLAELASLVERPHRLLLDV